MVITSHRELTEVLAETDTLIEEAFKLPPDGETVIHPPELYVIVQAVLEVILNDFEPAEVVKSSVAGETVKVAASPSCVTVICLSTPPTFVVTVITAVRDTVEVLAETLTLIVASLLPPDDETVTHPPELFVIVQPVLE